MIEIKNLVKTFGSVRRLVLYERLMIYQSLLTPVLMV